ncbi:MFS transporter [Streptacidiphilus sp. EB129]|uniref:MFS transporter n=1 Tax=Streptacidiphilus sp. EB129 TaxID=3156262 RepID=UPI0035181CEE
MNGLVDSLAPPAPAVDRTRWRALAVIACAQLMVVLDTTVVNIALPSAQRSLGISDGDRQWMITAYTLAFGGLLLLGGRLCDLIGRKRAFLTGLAGFAGASALGGTAHTAGEIFAARGVQGVFAALLAPAALSLLTTTFTEPAERARAFGLYSAVGGAGSALGLIAGGLLTQYGSWRWCLYVNVPIAAVAAAGAVPWLVDRRPGDRGEKLSARLDIPGALLGCGGLATVVYALSHAERDGWTDPGTLALFGTGAGLLAAFAVVEARTGSPLLPARILADRTRFAVYLTIGLAAVAMFGVFFFLTYYQQTVLGYRPLRTGLGFLPLVGAMLVAATRISARLLPHVAPRTLIIPGLLTAAAGLWLLTGLDVHSSWTTLVLPAQILIGLGLGAVAMPCIATATLGVAERDAGIASATVNTAQQIGASLGTALLNTIAAGAATRALTRPGAALDPATAAVHGYAVATAWAAGILLAAAALAATLLQGVRDPSIDARAVHV